MRQRVALFFSVWDAGTRRTTHVGDVQMTLRPIDDQAVGQLRDDDPMLLEHEHAQQLLDELWRLGLRPRDGAGSLAHVEATRAHLDDMRRLVFKDGGKD